MDVAPVELFSLPIFTPLFGFSSITSPEIQLEEQEIPEGNWYFPRKVLKGGSIGAITLQRGVTFFDSDFWRWTMFALTGEPVTLTPFLNVGGATPRRDLLLIHFFAHLTSKIASPIALAALAGVASAQAGGGLGGAALAAAQAASRSAFGIFAPGPFEFAARIPAKAWLLTGCLPLRYKAGSDFDASSGEISLQELDVSVEGMEEFGLGA